MSIVRKSNRFVNKKMRNRHGFPSEAIIAVSQLFTLQGNFNVKKLHGVYRLMMEIMVRAAGKSLAAKKDRTPAEDDRPC